MCEINPKHSQIYRLEFFTTADITKEEFEAIITQAALEFEIEMNENGKIRCHVHEYAKDNEIANAKLTGYNTGYITGYEEGQKYEESRHKYPDTTGQ